MTSSRNWYPLAQAAFLTYAQNFCGQINTSPTTFGCVAADGTSLMSLLGALETKFAISEAPETKTPVSIAQKDMAMAALRADMRRVYKKVRAANLSPDLLIELGVPVPDPEPSPVPTPTDRAQVTVRSTKDRAVNLFISSETTPTKRGKPTGCSGWELFSFAGETPPGDLGLWKFEGAGTKAYATVTFGPSTPAAGTKVWFAVRWVNAKGQAGPVSALVSTFLGGGVVGEAA
jgi:hypothetical protein